MRIVISTILIFAATQIVADESNIATMSLGEIQAMYEVETDKAAARAMIVIHFRAYLVGFVHGLSHAANLSVGKEVDDTNEDMIVCLPNATRLFYKLLSVEDDKLLEKNMIEFLQSEIYRNCGSVVFRVFDVD